MPSASSPHSAHLNLSTLTTAGIRNGSATTRINGIERRSVHQVEGWTDADLAADHLPPRVTDHWPDPNHLHHQHQTDQELDKQRGFPSGPDIEVRACNWEWDCVEGLSLLC